MGATATADEASALDDSDFLVLSDLSDDADMTLFKLDLRVVKRLRMEGLSSWSVMVEVVGWWLVVVVVVGDWRREVVLWVCWVEVSRKGRWWSEVASASMGFGVGRRRLDGASRRGHREVR